MPHCTLLPLSRVYAFSRGESLHTISGRISKDLKVDPKQIFFMHGGEVLIKPKHEMLVLVRVINCNHHPPEKKCAS